MGIIKVVIHGTKIVKTPKESPKNGMANPNGK